MPFDDNTFDGAYAIEATCHSGNLGKVFSEVYRVLKPGGVFAVYDWLMTDKYDENNAQHRKIKHDIEVKRSTAISIAAPLAAALFT